MTLTIDVLWFETILRRRIHIYDSLLYGGESYGDVTLRY
jgi:hypothetical protein